MTLRQNHHLRQASLPILFKKIFFTLACAICLLARTSFAGTPVTLKISNTSGYTIPDEFIGLSFETSVVLPNPNKVPNAKPFYLFSPTNQPLIAAFKNLGIKNLRVGGGTVDMSRRPVPGPKDIDQLFAFAKAADIKIIYSFRLLNGDPTNAAALARYIWRNYRKRLDSFSIGNEPDWPAYHRTDPKITNYPSYLADWRTFAAAIHAAIPRAKFSGPDTGSDYPIAGAENTDYHGQSWTELFANDEKDSGLIKYILHHDYIGQSAKGVPQTTAIDAMLSQHWVDVNYPALYDHVLAPVTAVGLPFRMTECNDYTFGVDGASNAFASALWALDYMHWWAAHGCAGVNFHNNEWLYTDTVFLDPAGSLHLNPKAYGIKAFDLGSHGNVIPIEISNPDEVNLTAYAVRNSTNLFVTIINKEHGSNARTAEVTIASEGQWRDTQVIFLTGQPADKTGMTLGGATISDDGSWNGTWKNVKADSNGQYLINISPATATIIKFP
jgi:hypothetical protein